MLDHDNLGGFVQDADNIVRQSLLGAMPDHPQTLLVFPRDVANEECRRLFLASVAGQQSLIALDSRNADAIALFEKVFRKVTRNPTMPSFGLKVLRRPHSENVELQQAPNDGSPYLAYLRDDEEDSWRALEGIGLSRERPYICFNVRDQSYSDTLHPQHSLEHATQDYRNPPLRNYLPAIESLLHDGYDVVRTGATASEVFPIQHPRFFHYAGSVDRSDRLDLLLYSHCRFAIQGSGSGIDTLATLFDRPLVVTDFVPIALALGGASSSALRLLTPALIERTVSGEVLGLREMGVHSYTSTSEYTAAGLQVRHNTAKDIQRSVYELISRIDDHSSEPSVGMEPQYEFWAELLSSGRWKGRDQPKMASVGRTIFIPEFFINEHW